MQNEKRKKLLLFFYYFYLIHIKKAFNIYVYIKKENLFFLLILILYFNCLMHLQICNAIKLFQIIIFKKQRGYLKEIMNDYDIICKQSKTVDEIKLPTWNKLIEILDLSPDNDWENIGLIFFFLFHLNTHLLIYVNFLIYYSQIFSKIFYSI